MISRFFEQTKIVIERIRKTNDDRKVKMNRSLRDTSKSLLKIHHQPIPKFQKLSTFLNQKKSQIFDRDGTELREYMNTEEKPRKKISEKRYVEHLLFT